MNPSPERQKLENSINELYDVFAKYPLPDWINCNSHQEKSRLNCLKQITYDDFEGLFDPSPMAFKSMLPRVFEWIAFGELVDHQVLRLVEGLHLTSEWQSWDADEYFTVNKCLINLWKYLLSDHPSPVDNTIEIAEGIDYIYIDVTIYIKILEERCETLEGIQHLADMVICGIFGYKLTRQQWVLPLLEKIYYEHIDTPIGDLMAMAVKEIEQNG